MPVLHCPNCGARVRVADHLVGKAVHCSKCAGAFIAAPDGEVAAAVADWRIDPPSARADTDPSATPPEPPADGMADGWAGASPPPGRPRRRSPIVVAIAPATWKGADASAGWALFWTLLVLGVIITVLLIVAVLRGHDRGLDSGFALLNWVIIALAIVHGVLWVVALFWVAANSRQYNESVAPWLLLMFLYQGIALALYLVSRPQRDD